MDGYERQLSIDDRGVQGLSSVVELLLGAVESWAASVPDTSRTVRCVGHGFRLNTCSVHKALTDSGRGLRYERSWR